MGLLFLCAALSVGLVAGVKYETKPDALSHRFASYNWPDCSQYDYPAWEGRPVAGDKDYRGLTFAEARLLVARFISKVKARAVPYVRLYFQQFDTNNDGAIDYQEAESFYDPIFCYKQSLVAESDRKEFYNLPLEVIFKRFDSDKNTRVSEEEVIRHFQSSRIPAFMVLMGFYLADVDLSRRLSKDEFKGAICSLKSEPENCNYISNFVDRRGGPGLGRK